MAQFKVNLYVDLQHRVLQKNKTMQVVVPLCNTKTRFVRAQVKEHKTLLCTVVVRQQIQVKQTAAEKGVVKYLFGSVHTPQHNNTADAH